jgi:hypothetical protein
VSRSRHFTGPFHYARDLGVKERCRLLDGREKGLMPSSNVGAQCANKTSTPCVARNPPWVGTDRINVSGCVNWHHNQRSVGHTGLMAFVEFLGLPGPKDAAQMLRVSILDICRPSRTRWRSTAGRPRRLTGGFHRYLLSIGSKRCGGRAAAAHHGAESGAYPICCAGSLRPGRRNAGAIGDRARQLMAMVAIAEYMRADGIESAPLSALAARRRPTS